MDNKKYFIEYRLKNKDKLKQYHRDYYLKNRDIVLTRVKEYRKKHPETMEKWRKNNVEKTRQNRKKNSQTDKYKINRNKHTKERKQNDIQYKIKMILRSRINRAIRAEYKTGSAVRDLGCSIQELKLYIESKFRKGMTWQNHGQFGWHFDHIKQLKDFDLTDKKQFKKAVHYTNLQPMWWKDNLDKRFK